MRRRRGIGVLLVLLVAGAGASPVAAQEEGFPVRGEITVNSELERYLRVLQVAGEAQAYPWSLRSFSALELGRIVPADSVRHPWDGRYDLGSHRDGGFGFSLIRPRFRTIYNSSFPVGGHDGAVWAGRGFTTASQIGLTAWAGPLSLTVAPEVFWAQNAEFDLLDTGHDGTLAFADPRNPTTIDSPQRFGAESYGRVDPGQSALRLDLPWVALGVSTANQHWGPAQFYPLLLGDNAPGFTHVFLGTGTPLDLWIARVHGRIVWGRLEQSEYASVTGDEARRFMSGIVLLLTPRGVEGIEIGGARFFHEPWPEGGPDGDDLLRPLDEFFGENLEGFGSDDDPDRQVNQLLSVFFRWAFPGSGFEVYGEFAREDRNFSLRDFLVQPDHDAAYMLGLARVWERPDDRLLTFRAELANGRISHLDQVRVQTPFYRHSAVSQGHTHRGQILGAPELYGGSALTLAVDRYGSDGRWTISWQRELRKENLDPSRTFGSDGDPDILYHVTVERLLHYRFLDVLGELTGSLNQNRHFGASRGNVRAALSIRAALP